MDWTKEQKEAIDFRGNNLLVSAAAGSGKTAVLIERIKTMLLEDRIPITSMLIVTFTNAAAAEMRFKLQEALMKEMEKPDSDKLFLRNQLALLGEADISTFNSFALSIVRRYFYMLDLEPDFTICDEAKADLLKKEAMSILFNDLFLAKDEEFLHFLDNYTNLKNYNNAERMIADAHNKISVILNKDEWKQKILSDLTDRDFNRERIKEFLFSQIKYCLSDAELYFSLVADRLSEAGVYSLKEKADEDLAALQTLKSFMSGGFWENGYYEFCERISVQKWSTFRVLKKYEDEKYAFEQIKDSINSIRKQGKRSFDKAKELARYNIENELEYIAESHDAVRILLKLTDLYDEIYSDLKRAENLVDFTDVEHFAIRLLENPDVRLEYQNKYEHVLVDEYQDSNHIQDRLIYLVSRGDNVFMVGDVKQSIYKFRLAEPEIFTQKQEEYRKSPTNGNSPGCTIELNTNFRSKKMIINSVNDVFMGLIDNYEREKLNQGLVDHDGRYDFPVKLVAMVTEDESGDFVDEEIRSLNAHEMEAYRIAFEINSILGTEIYDNKLQKERKIELRDIVVLMRSVVGKAAIYADILGEHGIDVHTDDAASYFNTLEISVFVNMLKAINNKRNDLALLSFLHSPMMGFSARELAEIRQRYRKMPFYYSLVFYGRKNKDNLAEKCRFAVSKIKEWAGESKLLKVDELCRILITETRFYTYLGTLKGGAQRQANLKAIIDKATQFSAEYSGDLSSFLDYINSIQVKGIEIPQVSLIGEDDNVVRIMTIHKSKGLEYPIVIIAGIGRNLIRGENVSDMNFHKDIGIAMTVVNKSKRMKYNTILQEIVRTRNAFDSLMEEIRILYVAMTRARDMLIMVGKIKSADEIKLIEKRAEISDTIDKKSLKNFFSMIFPARCESDETVFTTSIAGIGRTGFNGGNVMKENAKSCKDILERIDTAVCPEIYSRRLEYVYPYEPDTKKEVKRSVTAIVNEGNQLILPDKLSPRFISGKRVDSVQRGTINHIVFQHLPIKELRSAFDAEYAQGMDAFNAYLSKLANDGKLTREDLKVVDVEGIVSFVRSDLGRRAAAADILYREETFYLMREDVLVQGTVDSYFMEKDGVVLIDYKSNFVDDPGDNELLKGIAESYKQQMDIYQKAIEEAGEMRVKERYIYLISAGKAIEI